MSDTILGALWLLDLMALLARFGCSGVNVETGVNQLGFVSSYSPIWDDGRADKRTGAPYYGMLAFASARAGCGQNIAVDLSEDRPGLTAYAFGNDGTVRSLVLINRSTAAVNVSTATLGLRTGAVNRLTGPASNGTTGVMFGGAAVDADGFWSAQLREHMRDGLLHVPSMCAAVVTAG